MQFLRVAVIGGGAAGFFAAARLVESPDIDVTLFEAGSKFLSKVQISGGGRCNVTHDCESPKKLIEFYPRGGKELLGAFSRFGMKETVEWYRSRGVELKTEGDGRMFPVTDRSKTIIDALIGAVKERKCTLTPSTKVRGVIKTERGFEVRTSAAKSEFDAIILATGGSRAGHEIAATLGHSLTELAPSLFTFECRAELLDGLEGLSFPEATVAITGPGKFHQRGPLLITHWGLSGPAVLKLSAWAARELARCDYRFEVELSWAGVSEEHVKKDLKEYRSAQPTREVANYPLYNLPKRFWSNLVAAAGVEVGSTYAVFSNEQLLRVAQLISRCKLQIEGKGEFKEEFVTCGGVSLKEVDCRTMQSKIHQRLFFAGEILDVDGVTGGFNFQAAWTTGWLAANTIVETRSSRR